VPDLDNAFHRTVTRLGGLPDDLYPLVREFFDAGAVAGAQDVLVLTAQLGDTVNVMRRLVALLEETTHEPNPR
jgi:hypothetical protein